MAEEALDSHKIDIAQKTDLEAVTNYESAITPNSGKLNKSFDVKGVTLRWKDVSLEVKTPATKAGPGVTKKILSGISGEAAPGELLVIMGPSGAGKSSLLDVLAGRNNKYTGSVTVNGAEWDQRVTRVAAYVLQDDLFYGTLTVEEHLMFQAQLRMGADYPIEERKARVDTVLEELGLSKCRSTLIGNERVRGVSGGERKRLSFATELLTNPSLLFVDEPTSGLDSFMAEAAVQKLREVAREGRTVIATIHQPSSDVYALFDKLLLIADGGLVFHDTASKALDHFAKQGLQCPNYTNPSDYFMRQLVVFNGEMEQRKNLDSLKSAWETHTQSLPAAAEVDLAKETDELNQLAHDSKPLSLAWQIGVLCKRNVLRVIKDKLSFNARIGQNLFLSLIVGLIYLQLDLDREGAQNFSGALFFLTVNRVFGDASPLFLTLPLELPIVVREHRAGLYYSSSWYLSKCIADLPFEIFMPLIFLFPAYFLIGFGGGVDTFLTFFFILVLLSGCATGLGYMVACLTGKPEVAAIVGPITILPFLLFGGLFLNSESAPVYFVWLQYLSPIKYGYEALMVTFWKTVDSVEIVCADQSTVGPCFATGQKVLESFNFDDISVWSNCALLFAINIGFRFIGLLALSRYVNKKTS